MAKSSVPVKSIKRNFRNIILGLIVFLLLLAAYFLWAFLPGSTEKIESIADQFKPESSWKLASETITPPYNVCIDAQCEKLRKVWDLGEELKTTEQFQKIATLDGSALNLTACTISTGTDENLKLCRASDEVDEYIVTVEYTKYRNEKPDISLNVESKR